MKIPKNVPPGMKLAQFEYEFYAQLVGRKWWCPKEAWVRKSRRKTIRY